MFYVYARLPLVLLLQVILEQTTSELFSNLLLIVGPKYKIDSAVDTHYFKQSTHHQTLTNLKLLANPENPSSELYSRKTWMRNGTATPMTSIGFFVGAIANRELSTDTADNALNNSMHTNTVSDKVCGNSRPELRNRASQVVPSGGCQVDPHLPQEDSCFSDIP